MPPSGLADKPLGLRPHRRGDASTPPFPPRAPSGLADASYLLPRARISRTQRRRRLAVVPPSPRRPAGCRYVGRGLARAPPSLGLEIWNLQIGFGGTQNWEVGSDEDGLLSPKANQRAETW